MPQKKHANALVLSVAVLGLAMETSQALTVVYDSNGFESPPFANGALEGQDPVNGPWVRTPGVGSGVVQTGTVASGARAVQLNRSGQDIRYGIAKSIDNVGLSANPIIAVDWSMNYQASTVPPTSFGPYIGVEIYDDSNGPALLGASAGVDAKTSELLFQAPGTGFLTVVPGVTVAPNSWHNYRLEMNYATHTYRLFFDGNSVLTSAFVDAGITDFTDADIAALAGAGDPASLEAAGTGYFDNFRITQIPEPETTALCGAFGLLMLARRRSA